LPRGLTTGCESLIVGAGKPLEGRDAASCLGSICRSKGLCERPAWPPMARPARKSGSGRCRAWAATRNRSEGDRTDWGRHAGRGFPAMRKVGAGGREGDRSARSTRRWARAFETAGPSPCVRRFDDAGYDNLGCLGRAEGKARKVITDVLADVGDTGDCACHNCVRVRVPGRGWSLLTVTDFGHAELPNPARCVARREVASLVKAALRRAGTCVAPRHGSVICAGGA